MHNPIQEDIVWITRQIEQFRRPTDSARKSIVQFLMSIWLPLQLCRNNRSGAQTPRNEMEWPGRNLGRYYKSGPNLISERLAKLSAATQASTQLQDCTRRSQIVVPLNVICSIGRGDGCCSIVPPWGICTSHARMVERGRP
jgi:hypothetical protein